MTADAHGYLPDGLPDGLLDADERTLLRALGRPTLVRFPGGTAQAPRAVSVLLHGDEPTGFQALLRVLRRRPRLPYDLYVIVGNVQAALAPPGYAVRYLDDQEDLNRVWEDHPDPGPLRSAALAVLARLRAAGLASLVDLHNTSGDTPFYAIATRVTPATINLATQFTTRLLHWELTNGALVQQLDDLCPAIAVECGLAGRRTSLEFALDGLRRYLGAGTLVTDRVLHDHDLLHGLHRVTVRPDARFRFGGPLADDLDLVIPPDADTYNLVEVPAGHPLGTVRAGADLPLEVVAPDGRDVTADLLTVQDGQVVLTRPATPVMMTRTVTAVRKDCLTYLAVDPTRPPLASSAATSSPANRSSSGRSKGTSERSSV